MRRGASSTSFHEPLNPGFTKTAWRSLPELEVMPQLSALDLVREAACQLEPIPPAQQTQTYTKSLLVCSVLLTSSLQESLSGRQKCSGKSALSPLSFSALLLCQVQVGSNGQLASAKPFPGCSQSHQKQGLSSALEKRLSAVPSQADVLKSSSEVFLMSNATFQEHCLLLPQ